MSPRVGGEVEWGVPVVVLASGVRAGGENGGRWWRCGGGGTVWAQPVRGGQEWWCEVAGREEATVAGAVRNRKSLSLGDAG